MTELTLLDVCAGIGSFSLGAHRNGIKTVAQIELEANRRDVLQKHFPDAIKLGDIYNVTTKDIPDRINIMAGGTPCQDLSVAGKRAGLDGAKSSVWFEYLRLVKSLKPEWVVWENVPGALSSNQGRDFRTILMGLDELGYGICWRIFDAQYCGVPQRRRRIFLVASLGNGRCAKVLFERESVPGNSKTRPESWQATSRITGNGVNQSNRLAVMRNVRSDIYTPDDISSTLTKNNSKQSSLDLVVNPIVVKTSHTGSNGKGILTDGTTHTLSKSSHTDAVLAFRGQVSVQQGLSTSDKISPAMIKNQVNNVMHNQIVRRLTPTECERLQGFPDSWTAGHSNSQRYSMLGDSIAVPNSEWIMRRIKEVHQS